MADCVSQYLKDSRIGFTCLTQLLEADGHVSNTLYIRMYEFVTCAVIYFKTSELIVQSEVVGMSVHVFGKYTEGNWYNVWSFKGASSVSPYWAAEDG